MEAAVTLAARRSVGVRIVLAVAFVMLSACSDRSPAPAAQRSTAPDPAAINPSEWPSITPPIAKDAALEERIDGLIAGMSIEQKVGQLIQADIGSITPEDLRVFPLGSILNGGSSGPNGNDFAPAREWLAAADAFYEASLDPAHGQNAIPVLWGTDAVHGNANIIGATIFPHNIGLGAMRNPEVMRRIGEVTAREIAVTGQGWNFAPTLAVVRDDRWGRTYESYSEDPQIVREYASAVVIGLQGQPGTPEFLDPQHVISTAKHYLGDGGTGGRDQGDNRSPEKELRDIHAAGYPPAVGSGVQTIMTSFSSWQGIKMTVHRGLIVDVLKGRMGFDGFVVTDWNAHGQVPGCTNESCPAAINAGIDMVMAPDSWKGLYQNTLAQVKSGEIPMARVEDAVRRILRVKIRSGLFERGRPSSRPLAGKFELLGSPEHREVARQAVRESLVLLKNQNKVLPLAAKQTVLVTGDGADNVSKQCGGWTLTWQGTGVTKDQFPGAESIYSGIRKAVTAGGGRVELSPDGKFKRKPDVAIVVFGENPYAEFQGDVTSVVYNPNDTRDLDLLRSLKSQGIPVVAVFLSGRPMWMNREINASDAFIAAWLPGSEGAGIADVIFRKPDGSVNHDFRGRLSFSWPRLPQQNVVNREDGGEPPLFPYGFGLRYSDNGDLETLSEEIGSIAALTADTQLYFTRGRLGTGWSWVTGNESGTQPLPKGVTRLEEGPVQISPIDRAAQEDARLLRWNGSATARAGIAGEVPIDLRRESNGQLALAFDYRVDEAASADVTLSIDCGPGCTGAVPITQALAGSPIKEWRQLKIPLSCFEKAGTDMSRVTAPLLITTKGRLSLAITEARLESSTSGVMACPG